MKWTKQRIVSVGVLAAAAVAFVVDRAVLHKSDVPAGGAAVAAGPVPAARQATADGGAGGVNAREATAAADPLAALARQLDDVSSAEAVAAGTCGDAFRPPAQWFGSARSTPAAEPGAAVADGADAFLAGHKLSAVMRNGPRGGQGIAVIRGRTLRVGQAIDGFTLAAVGDDWVTLTDGRGGQVRLDLPKPDLAAAH